MQLALTEDQELIAKTVADFAAEKSPLSRVRALRDTADPLGFSRPLWEEMAELGWVGIPLPEAHGGAGLGLAELAVVLEALGRTLAPEPFLSSVLLAGQALAIAGTEAQQEAWLPGIVAGKKLASLAFQEPSSRYDVHHVTMRAEPQGEGWRLTGEKIQVLDAGAADLLVVSARTAGSDGDADGITLFLVPAEAEGVKRIAQQRVDHRAASLVRFEGVSVPADGRLGEVGAAGALLEDVLDRATVGLCAEMLGAMEQAFELTLEHLKERKQFDAPIGSFQALKHRAADVFMEIELSRSTVMAAARGVDDGAPDARRLVSLAKARCSEAFILAANEGVQMFGGVGMTDEYDIGFYLKRARAAEMTFGDAAFHRARWATLGDY